jgi:hypothetical protein
MRANKNILKAWLSAALLCTCTLAHAQSAQPVAGTENNGIRIGDGRLHPYIDLELRYDSAALVTLNKCGGTATTPGVCGDLVAHVRPGMILNVPDSWVDFSLSGNADFVWFTGLLTKSDTSSSYVGGTANMSAAFNRTGSVEADLTDTFSRSDTPHDPSLGVGVLSLYNEVALAAPIHPGGQALQITPKAAFEVEYFSPIVSSGPSGVSPGYANYRNLDFELNGRWRFLPKTAVVVDTNFQDRTYVNTGNAQALLFRAQAGLAGLLSPRVSVVAKAGWAKDFGQSSGNAFIGIGELTYLFNAFTTLRAGILRTVEPVSLYGTYTDLRPYVEGRALLMGRLQLHALLAYDLLSYSTPTTALAATNSGRQDNIWSLDLGPQYEVTPWLIVTAGYLLGSRDTNLTAPIAIPGATSTAQVLNFTRNEAYLRVTLTY